MNSPSASAEPVVTLLALVQRGRRREVRRLAMDQALQREVAALFAEQARPLLDPATTLLAFDAGYKPEDGEAFTIPGFALPGELTFAIGHVQAIDKLLLRAGETPPIRALVAVERHAEPDLPPTVYFQPFAPARLIEPRRSLFFANGSFALSTRPELLLGGKIAAVHVDGALRFCDYRAVNAFLDLGAVFKEASSEEIADVLTTSFAASAPARTASQASQWMRKRFAMLRASQVLTRFTLAEIRARAVTCEVTVLTASVDGAERLVFPDEPAQAKKLLQFLNEELYRGPLSQQLFETNSRRSAGA